VDHTGRLAPLAIRFKKVRAGIPVELGETKMIKRIVGRIKRKFGRIRLRVQVQRRAPIFDNSAFDDDLALLPIYVDERRSR
jgi:hypothetical protein